ncbi:MAG: PAS domain-containing protein [Gammaproteobacteria bacterium]|nr:PAS domain-containing protein [Gammaproteobacteria bacterium]
MEEVRTAFRTLQDRSGELLEELTGMVPVPMAIFTPELRCLSATRTWLEAFGQPPEGRAEALHLHDFVGEAHAAWRDLCDAVLQQGIVATRRHAVPLAGGASRALLVHLRPLGQGDGAPVGIVMTLDVKAVQQEQPQHQPYLA